ncbi:peroxidase superfamily protein [Striga asiatica]|uniref:peroxidase n=1 Tax=Striga asiatica TaxID=4170 RepID=A0A5A7PGT5_STRAF|nr:peroxidase superfamily protein [Striga asiatica]
MSFFTKSFPTLIFTLTISLVLFANALTQPVTRKPKYQLSVDFYAKTCPQLDQLVASVTSQQFKEAPISAPATIRLFFHDCFVETGGPYYPVKKGRWDGKISLASRVQPNLPRANSTVDELLKLFGSKGLTLEDLVILSGAHTIGFANCRHFVGRLYDYKGTKKPDPWIDPRLLKALKMSCPRFGGNTDIVAPFDVTTPFSFDNAYYGNLEAKMGLLGSDQALFVDLRTKGLVQAMAKDKQRFFQEFALAMDKMGGIGVKRGRRHGEKRKDCTLHM